MYSVCEPTKMKPKERRNQVLMNALQYNVQGTFNCAEDDERGQTDTRWPDSRRASGVWLQPEGVRCVVRSAHQAAAKDIQARCQRHVSSRGDTSLFTRREDGFFAASTA